METELSLATLIAQRLHTELSDLAEVYISIDRKSWDDGRTEWRISISVFIGEQKLSQRRLLPSILLLQQNRIPFEDFAKSEAQEMVHAIRARIAADDKKSG